MHPDKRSGADAAALFDRLSDAYEILGDADKRAIFDGNDNFAYVFYCGFDGCA